MNSSCRRGSKLIVCAGRQRGVGKQVVSLAARAIISGALGFLPIGHDSMATEFAVSSAAQISSVMSSQAQPGDTLTMATGTWTNQHIIFQGNGTPSLPILLRSGGGYGSVVLNGTSTLRIAGNYLIVDGLKFQGGYSASGDVIEFRNGSSLLSTYSRLTNTGVISYNPANDSTDYKWISVYGTHNRVDHCYVENKTHSGTTVVVWRPASSPNYHQIDHNYLGPRSVLGYNGGETIRIGTSDQSLSSSYTVVEYNYFDRCNGEIEIISNKSCDNIYRYNTFVNCLGTLTLRHGNRCRVEGNFFFGNRLSSSGGIRIIGEDHVVINNYIAGTRGDDTRSALSMMDGIDNSPLNGYYQVKRAIVAFNTFVDNDYNIDIGAGRDADNILPPLDCVVANNIVYGTHAPLIVQTDTAINLQWQGNIFFGATLGISPIPSGITISDPLLSPTGGDGLRHLSGTSPAINAAQGSYEMVSIDMDGQMRDVAKDIGADEFSTAPVTIRPLTAGDVGPSLVSYVITVTQSPHGAIAPGTISIQSGSSQRFTVTPDPNCRLDSIIVDGQYVPDSTNGFTFINVLVNHTLTARFGITQYSLTVSAENGTIVRNPDLPRYDSGSTVQLTALPAGGYEFVQWTGDASGSDNPTSVLMDGPRNVSAEFHHAAVQLPVTVNGRWNMLSLPVRGATNDIDSIFGGRISRAFIYDGAYHEVSTIELGRGVWIKYADSTTIVMTGRPIMADTIAVAERWNLIGSISTSVATTNIIFDPPTGSVSPFYAFNGLSYVEVDSIRPGYAYWVKADRQGRLFLSAAPPSPTSWRDGVGSRITDPLKVHTSQRVPRMKRSTPTNPRSMKDQKP